MCTDGPRDDGHRVFKLGLLDLLRRWLRVR